MKNIELFCRKRTNDTSERLHFQPINRLLCHQNDSTCTVIQSAGIGSSHSSFHTDKNIFSDVK